MASKVYFTNLRTKPGVSLLDKLEKLVVKAGIETLDCKDKFTAIKIHFGEPGNLAYIRPNYARRVVSILNRMGTKVYLTDANTLYSGGRSNAVDHLDAAMTNGFNPMVVGAPVVIADGIKGTEYRELPVIGGETCSSAKIGSGVADADVIVSMTHFKGHEMSGFGGALKNLGMGAASVGGKLFLHSASQPKIVAEKCVSCGMCVRSCAHDAVHFNDTRKAEIDYTKCVGCGQCVAVCQYDSAQVVHDSTSELLNQKIAEYTKAILEGKPNFHISFIMNVSPDCDCWGSNDMALVPDIGIAASFDPVALDMACADLVTAAPAIVGSRIFEEDNKCCAARTSDNASGDGAKSGATHEGSHGGGHDHEHSNQLQGQDKFAHAHPNTNWRAGLVHAEKLGMGSMEYELVTI